MSEGSSAATGIERAHARPLTPAQAADRLGVKAAMLRRHASAYEATFGPLPRDERGARCYPLEALHHLHHAILAYRDGAAPSVAEALRQRATGEPTPTHDTAPTSTGSLALLLTEVQALARRLDDASITDADRVAQLQARVIELQDQVRELERRNDGLRTALRDTQDELKRERDRSLWRRLFYTR